MSLFAGFLYIKVERGFLAHTVKVVEDTQPFIGFQLHALAAEPAEVSDQVSAHTGKIMPCVLNILLVDGNRHILILHDGICPRRFLQKDFVVFLTVFIESVAFHRDKDVVLKVQSV